MTVQAQEDVLPAPVYVMDSDKLLQRIDVDGESIFTVTDEAILDFDVSGDNILYITAAGNDLVFYNNDAVITLIDGPEPRFNENGFFDEVFSYNDLIREPLWNPVGGTFAFAQGGVQLFDVATGNINILLPNQPVAIESRDDSPMERTTYAPLKWSPDGNKLVVQGFGFEGQWLSILDVNTGQLLRIEPQSMGVACCDASWTADSSVLYVSSLNAPSMGLPEAGLWSVDPATGTATRLSAEIDLETGALEHYGQAIVLDDGIYTFFGSSSYENSLLKAQMQRLDDSLAAETLREDVFSLVNILWAADGSGAVIYGTANFDENGVPGELVLHWIPAGDGEIIQLPLTPAEPVQMAWGN